MRQSPCCGSPPAPGRAGARAGDDCRRRGIPPRRGAGVHRRGAGTAGRRCRHSSRAALRSGVSSMVITGQLSPIGSFRQVPITRPSQSMTPTAPLPRTTRVFLAGNTVSMVGTGLVLPFILIYLHQVRGIATPGRGGTPRRCRSLRPGCRAACRNDHRPRRRATRPRRDHGWAVTRGRAAGVGAQRPDRSPGGAAVRRRVGSDVSNTGHDDRRVDPASGHAAARVRDQLHLAKRGAWHRCRNCRRRRRRAEPHVVRGAVPRQRAVVPRFRGGVVVRPESTPYEAAQ